jgi:hypothetical protein
MGGCTAMGGRPHLQEEVQDASLTEAVRKVRTQRQQARFKFLPSENRSLPHRAIPELGEEPSHLSALVVPVQETDARPPLPGMRHLVERPAEASLGGGHEVNREVETRLEDPERTVRREMQLGGATLPLHHRKTGPGGGVRAE